MSVYGALNDHGPIEPPLRYYVKTGIVQSDSDCSVPSAVRGLMESNDFRNRVTQWCVENCRGEWLYLSDHLFLQYKDDYIKFVLAF
jgi:hypothetical protein